MALRGSLGHRTARQVARLRAGGRPAVLWTLRLTTASVASYAVAMALFPGSEPLLAPLTTLLVVRVTPLRLLSSGLERVVSVVAGVSVAVAFAAVVDLTWWSLGVVIAVAMLVGQALRLGDNLAEVPISAMLVLGVGAYGTQAAAWQRIAETLVGAAVGVASTLLVPPRIASEDAGAALHAHADRVAELLDEAGDSLAQEDLAGWSLADRAGRWLGEARRLNHGIPDVGSALLRAEEGRRLNLRAVGTTDPGPGLRHGMEALEHSTIAVRGMLRALVDASGAPVWEHEELGPAVRGATAMVLHDQATGLRAFGRLVHAEARPAAAGPDTAALEEALDDLREAEARLTDLVLVDEPAVAGLHTTMLTTVRQLLAELDLGERTARRVRAHRAAQEQAARRRAALRATSRRLVPGGGAGGPRPRP